jgi:hypothetical protein
MQPMTMSRPKRSSCSCSGRVLFLDVGEHAGDRSELGVHAAVADDAARPPAGDARAHEGHVEAVGERRGRLEVGGGVLGHRHRLAGERGFLDLEIGGADQPHVGGDLVALLELDHVAGHQVRRRHLDGLCRRGARARWAPSCPSAR